MVDYLANEIEAFDPHLIGLQEVVQIMVQSPGDFLLGNAQPATEVVLDFLDILLAELQNRGLNYRVAATVDNQDVEAPNQELEDIRVIDREVILARSDVDVANVQGQHYSAFLAADLAGTSIEQPRGWVGVDATIEGTTVHVVGTHLETAGSESIQVAQGDELLALLNGVDLPVILLADMNSRADRSRTPTYGNFIEAGFQDAYALANPGDPGLTCCHDDDLRNAAPDFNRRIDHILFRGDFSSTNASVIGADADQRTPAGQWPSDHAGLTATLNSNVLTAVQDDYTQPQTEALEQNYPNPFNSSTTIPFSLSNQQTVRLQVYNLQGQPVTTLVNQTLGAGVYRVTWDGRNAAGQAVASGIYTYRLQTGAQTQVRHLTLLK